MTKPDPVKAAQVIKAITDHMDTPMFKESVNTSARYLFAKYQAYERAGFNAAQALELTAREVRQC